MGKLANFRTAPRLALSAPLLTFWRYLAEGEDYVWDFENLNRINKWIASLLKKIKKINWDTKERKKIPVRQNNHSFFLGSDQSGCMLLLKVFTSIYHLQRTILPAYDFIFNWISAKRNTSSGLLWRQKQTATTAFNCSTQHGPLCFSPGLTHRGRVYSEGGEQRINHLHLMRR